MKKKLLIFALVMLLAISACFGMVACGGDSTDGDANNGSVWDPETNPGESEELVLVENNKPTFQFVFAYEASSSVKNAASSMIKTVNKLLSSEAKQITENPDNEKEIEIIIGTPKFRADECAQDPHYLGPEGYAVKVIGKKVLVLYGSDSAATNAINHVEKVLFGIDSKTKNLGTIVASADKLVEDKQTFTLELATIGGNDLRDYVLQYPTSLREEAQAVQSEIYAKVGIWLPKGNASLKQKAIIIREIDKGSESSNPNGFIIYVDESQNLVIETEFKNKFSEGVNSFLSETILAGGKAEMHYAQDYVYDKYDARNIYYEDFGAKGNGVVDDFEAIKACHNYANQYGHTVNATPGATYLIGKNDAGTAATIKTNTNWNGCTFIFDDRRIQQPLTESQNNGIAVEGDPGYNTPVFLVDSDRKYTRLTGTGIPISTLSKGAENVGFAPGYRALLVVYNDNVKHYIRYGSNADDGKDQHEIILVDKDGNVDPSTPIQWDYEAITKIMIYHAADTPITISGGEFDEDAGIDNRTHIITRYNQGRSFYTYFSRNINIKRSNVVIENITHEFTDYKLEEDGGSGPPYNGLITVDYCTDVLVQGFEFVRPPSYHVETDKSNRMGTYDLSAGGANRLTFKNCNQSGFFLEDGSIFEAGCMGTNYCKNLTFDGVMLGRFDAHCGVYNVTIKDSTVNKLNFIGDGVATVENTVVYVDGANHDVINLRSDYGSTWFGDLVVNGLEMRYSDEPSDANPFSLLRATWYNHNFGYTVHMPQNIVLNDLSIVRFTYGIDENGNRWEEIDESTRNKQEILLYYASKNNVGSHTSDLSDPSLVVNGAMNNNPIVPTRSVVVNNYKYADNPVTVVMPTSPTFKGMAVTVDGVKIK